MKDLTLPASLGPVGHGDHDAFVRLYDLYIDTIYGTTEGRTLLARSIGTEIRARGAARVLDCAAGTGFPALDLATDPSHGLTIHCTDGDPAMLRVLRRQAAELGVTPDVFAPKHMVSGSADGGDPLLHDWENLGSIRGDYDYVLCRGNSLAYADTWTGDDRPTSLGTVSNYLANIAAKVRPGGYLHVDAPKVAELDEQEHIRRGMSGCSIWEQVTAEINGRRWDVAFKFRGGRTIKFRRFSSNLCIDDVAGMLDDLGFTDTEPVSLTGERTNFGVIIARRTNR